MYKYMNLWKLYEADKGNGGGGGEPPQGDGQPTDPPTTPPADPNAVPDTWDGVFEHARFKSLTAQNAELKKKLDKLEKDASKAASDKLKEQEKYKELAELKEKELLDLQSKVTASELLALKASIAAKTGLINSQMSDEEQSAMIARLQGEDAETITRDAESMVQLFGSNQPSGGIGGQLPGSPGGITKPLDQMTPEEIRNIPDNVLAEMMAG